MRTPAIIGVISSPDLGRAVPLHDLEVQRQVGDRAEQREPDDEPDHARDREDAVAEELERQDRLLGPALDERRTPRGRATPATTSAIICGAPQS